MLTPQESNKLADSLANRIENLYYNAEAHGADYFNEIIEDIGRLYHKDMRQLAHPMKMYGPLTETFTAPAGAWVYVDQNEGGVWLCDSTCSYSCEIDYKEDPAKLFMD